MAKFNPFDPFRNLERVNNYLTGGKFQTNEQVGKRWRQGLFRDYDNLLQTDINDVTKLVGEANIDQQSRQEILDILAAPDDEMRTKRSKIETQAYQILGDAKMGTLDKYKSRMKTEQLVKTILEKPGQKQTVLTERSNASKGILGV